ncbi:MAG TPA: histidinol-phosphate transaminase [Alphaproteobacteria bacterium]|nr:histidinol-phosphate transaminase [Alphaproteobacteria bacterium]
MDPQPRPGIMDIAPYKGGEARIEGIERPLRLASNENPFGASPAAVAAYHAAAAELHRYPDGGAARLRAAIGRAHGLDPERIVCGAGSDELLTLLVRGYAGPGDEVVVSRHGFLIYPIAARSAGATPVEAPEHGLKADVDALLACVTQRTRLVLIANPSNPTGSYLSAVEVDRLRKGLPDHVLLVLDAAYAEYVTEADYDPGTAFVTRHAAVVMTRTFSKAYGLASLRLGWALAPAAIVDVLNRLRGPFNVPGPTQAAGIAALDDQQFIQTCRTHNRLWRGWLAEALGAIGLVTHPSVCNFLLVEFPQDTDRNAAAALAWLKSRGVLVRGMGAYKLPGCLRITIGTEVEMRETATALADFMKR